MLCNYEIVWLHPVGIAKCRAVKNFPNVNSLRFRLYALYIGQNMLHRRCDIAKFRSLGFSPRSYCNLFPPISTQNRAKIWCVDVGTLENFEVQKLSQCRSIAFPSICPLLKVKTCCIDVWKKIFVDLGISNLLIVECRCDFKNEQHTAKSPCTPFFQGLA